MEESLPKSNRRVRVDHPKGMCTIAVSEIFHVPNVRTLQQAILGVGAAAGRY
jgi:hypothetical protein